MFLKFFIVQKFKWTCSFIWFCFCCCYYSSFKLNFDLYFLVMTVLFTLNKRKKRFNRTFILYIFFAKKENNFFHKKSFRYLLRLLKKDTKLQITQTNQEESFLLLAALIPLENGKCLLSFIHKM